MRRCSTSRRSRWPSRPSVAAVRAAGGRRRRRPGRRAAGVAAGGLAVELRIATARLPVAPWITNSAGWRLVAPPTGIIDDGQVRAGRELHRRPAPGRRARATGAPRAGAETRLTERRRACRSRWRAPAGTGRTATRPRPSRPARRAPATTATQRAAAALPALQARALADDRPDELLGHQHAAEHAAGRARAGAPATPAASRIWPVASLVRDRRDDVAGRCPRRWWRAWAAAGPRSASC